MHVYNPTLVRWKQEEKEFEIIPYLHTQFHASLGCSRRLKERNETVCIHFWCPWMVDLERLEYTQS